MRYFTIKHVAEAKVELDLSCVHKIVFATGEEDMQVSDGYHTMDELYDHRIALFIALCAQIDLIDEALSGNRVVWRSKLHHDGSSFGSWFILGLYKDKGEQITYHLPLSKWDATDFAETLEKAPEWDGHTPTDVITRLKVL